MRTSLLTLLLTVSIVFSLHSTSHAADAAAGVKKVQVEEFDKLRAKPNHVVLDVRTAEEFKAGHVAGAKNLDVHDPDFAKKLQSLDKSKTYLVHCAKGKRSAAASEQMSRAGLTNVIDFTGGFEAWKKAEKPIAKE